MLTLLLGTDWTANRQEIFRRLAEDVRQKKENRILMVPELISHDTERRLSAAAGDTSTRYVQVLPFTRLGRRVTELSGCFFGECLDGSGRIVAMAAAARQLHSRLKAYAAVETKPEFLTQLVDAVDELKRCCISSEDLMAAAAKTEGSFAVKLEELSLLQQTYDALCSRGKKDPRDQMAWVLEQLQEMDFAEKHVLYIDGFPDFTRQHLAILEHFIHNSPEVIVSLNCDCVDSHTMGFEKAGETAAQLIKCAKNAGVEVHITSVAPREDRLASVRQGLFQGKLAYLPQLQDSLKAIRSGSLYQECEAAAVEVMQLVQSGCRYRDIGIVCTEPQSYMPILRLVFGKCDIPVFMAGNEQVLQFGAISTVIFALDAALGGYEQRDMLRYLRSALSPISMEECDRIENYAIVWGISGKRWQEQWTGHPEGLSGQWDAEAQQELESLNELRQMLIAPLDRMKKGFAEAKKLSEQVKALCAFLEEIQFAERLSDLADDMDAAGDNRSAQILNQLWEILLSALEQLHDVLGETAWDSETFTRLLKLLLSQCDVGAIPPVLDAVSVGVGSAMRCQQQKHILLLGGNEGSLPHYGGTTGLLTDKERMALRDLGVPLTGSAMDGMQAEFAEIYGVFCGAEESIRIFCCDGQPSFVYRRLAAMAGGEQQADTTLTSQLRQPMSTGSYLAQQGTLEMAAQLGVAPLYEQLRQKAEYQMGAVQPENIRRLYGKKLYLSASQVDKQAECRLAYFLQYGLRARERKEATVDPAEFGSYVHAVLEQTAREVMHRGGFHAVSLEDTLALAHHYSKEYSAEHFAFLESQRMEYLFRRNMQELEMVVRELWRELSQGQYTPQEFELSFGRDGKLPAVEIPNNAMEAVLRGFVDRVDVWRHEDCFYFRVVDYKTGKKSFDYCDVFNGVGLQMLLYLFALESGGQMLMPGRRIAAGVQYFPARAPYVRSDGSMTEEQAEKERKALWKRSGLLLADEESLTAMDASEKMDTLCCRRQKDGSLSGDVADSCQMGQLRDYIMGLLGRMVEEIASGNVQPNPYTRGSSFNACTYCPYGAVCHKDSVSGRRNYKTMNAKRFWEEIGKEDGHG